MTENDLVELGVARAENGTLLAPREAAMRFTPIGRFYEIFDHRRRR